MRARHLLTAIAAFFPAIAWSGSLPDAGGRLPGTGGVSQIEGAAGGGLTPWALIAGYGTRDEVGLTTFYTLADPSDFRLRSYGFAIGVRDRVEVSAAQLRFGLGSTVPGQSIALDSLGVKVRLFGDAVFDQDRLLPQVALGLQYKHNRDFAVPELLGAEDDTGVDVYLAATKVWLAGPFGRTTLLNVTLRATQANQIGLLGFGGDRGNGYTIQPELSAGMFLTDRLAVGAEYRFKPNNLSAFPEDDFWDVWLAYFPCKRFSITLASVQLGQIADKRDQRAFYLSGQLSF